MRVFLLLCASLAAAPPGGLAAQPTELDFLAAFSAFAHSYNADVPESQVRSTAAAFWGVTGESWPLCRRLAAKCAAESGFFTIASTGGRMPGPESDRPLPRTDWLGLHYDGLARQARREGLLSTARWRRIPAEWARFKLQLMRDPALGNWLAAKAWMRMMRANGSADAADLKWANPGAPYLRQVLRCEGRFDTFDPAARRLSQPPRRNR